MKKSEEIPRSMKKEREKNAETHEEMEIENADTYHDKKGSADVWSRSYIFFNI